MRRTAAIIVALMVFGSSGAALAQSRNLAPGFDTLPKGAKVAIMPTDIELFSISMGGVQEPKADWTEAASRHFKEALVKKKKALGLLSVELAEADADEAAEINSLHGAIARSVGLHHFGPLKLPTKDGKLDWSMGESVAPIKRMTGADYALFSWVRDTYSSAERKAAMIGLALLGVGLTGGAQVGYASLVDLASGRVVWFNQLVRASGDLRDPDSAEETLEALLREFPVAK